MVVLNWAKTRTALFFTGSHTDYPTYYMIGSGSGTVASTQTELFNPYDRQAITAVTGDTAFKVKWTGDWNSVEMSGLTLREFGMCINEATTTGSMWSKTVIPNALEFDGTAELRIEETWEVF